MTFTTERISVLTLNQDNTCRDSVVYDLAGNVVYDYSDCSLDVVVTPAAGGFVSITNNSISNGVGNDVYLNFVSVPIGGSNMSNVLAPFGQTILVEMPANGTYEYSVVFTDYVSCYLLNQPIQVTGANNCSANFNYSISSSNLFGVNFTASNNQNTATTTYAWDFGDNTSSTSMNPTHVFPTSPTTDFEVCLTVSNTDGVGCTETSCQTILLTNPVECDAAFSIQEYTNSMSFVFQPSDYEASHSYV